MPKPVITCDENEERGGWVAHCAEYPDLSAWGDTRKAAIEMLERLIDDRTANEPSSGN